MSKQAREFLDLVRKWRWFVAKGSNAHIEMQRQTCVYAAADLFYPPDTSSWVHIGGRNYAVAGSALALRFGRKAAS